MSTPALSNIIRKRNTTGGIILTASHNPGGPNGDFGIKFNCANGGPAPTDFTDKIFKLSSEIKTYKICNDLNCDFSKAGTSSFSVLDKEFNVEVIDSIDDYVDMMKGIFDFNVVKEHLKGIKVFLRRSMKSLNSFPVKLLFSRAIKQGTVYEQPIISHYIYSILNISE